MQNYVHDLLFKEECFFIVGLCMNIHTKLGKGFKEIVYKDALEIDLRNNKINYEREKPFRILYDGIVLPSSFNADFFVFNSIILEIKAAPKVYPDNFKQTINYLKASQVKLGLLINFGEDRLKIQRIICSY